MAERAVTQEATKVMVGLADVEVITMSDSCFRYVGTVAFCTN